MTLIAQIKTGLHETKKYPADARVTADMLLARIKKMIVPILAASLLLCGCKGPQAPFLYSSLTATAVCYGVQKPEVRPYLEGVQPLLCELAATGTASPAAYQQALQVAAGKTPEAALVANAVLLLFIGAFDAQGLETNAPQNRVVAEAIFCQGIPLGLACAAPSPTSRSRARNTAPAIVRWPLVTP